MGYEGSGRFVIFFACSLFMGLSACDRQEEEVKKESSSKKTQGSEETEKASGKPKGAETETETEEPDSIFIEQATLGASRKSVEEKLGKPEVEKEHDDGRWSLGYKDVSIGGQDFKGASLTFKKDRLVAVMIPGKLSSSDYGRQFRQLVESLGEEWGEPMESGLEWPWGKPFDRSLEEQLSRKAVALTAVWETDNSWRMVGVGAGDPEDVNIMYYHRDSKAFENGPDMEDFKTITAPEKPWVGDRFVLGDLEYRVESVDVVSEVGGNLHKEEPSEGALWVRVDYTVKNVAKSTTTVPTNRMRLADTKDRVFSPSSKGMTAVTMSEGKDLIVSQFQPGIEKEQVAIFEVPRVTAKRFNLVFLGPTTEKDERVSLRFGWPTVKTEK